MKLEISPNAKGKARSESRDQTTSSTGNMLLPVVSYGMGG